MTSPQRQPNDERPAGSSPWPAVPVLAVVGTVSAAVAAGLVIPLRSSVTGLLDLRIYLGAAGNAFTDGSIYDVRDPTFNLGSTYPPFWSLLLKPLTAFDIEAVELVWSFGILVMWFATLWLLARPLADDGDRAGAAAPPSPWWVVFAWVASIGSVAIWNTLHHGQVNVLIWFLVVLDLRAVLERRRAAGVGIGLATAIKLHPGLIAVLLAAAGRWTVAVRAFVAFLVTTVATAALLWSDSVSYWTSRIFDTSKVGDTGDAQSNALRALVDRADLPGPLAAVVLYAGILVVLGVTVFQLRRSLAARALVTTAVLVGVAGALATPITWMHHLVFLCFPLLLLRNLPWPLAGRVAAVVLAAVVLLDPIGAGRSHLTSSLRTVAMVAIVLGAGLLTRLEVGGSRAADDSRPLREWSAR